ncbi:hypothetical protein D3C85_1709270 [compost metagenome]
MFGAILYIVRKAAPHSYRRDLLFYLMDEDDRVLHCTFLPYTVPPHSESYR